MNFPSNAALNQQHTESGRTWKWNGVAWDMVSIADAEIALVMDAREDAVQAQVNAVAAAAHATTVTGGGQLEKMLVPVALPAMTPINFAEGRFWRMKLTANAKLANPVGMRPGDTITLVVEQDLVGGRTLDYDGAYGFPDATFPKLSTVPQATDTLVLYMTGDYTLQCDLRKNYSVVRPLVYRNGAFEYALQTAVAAVQTSGTNFQTVQILRDGAHAEVNAAVGFNTTPTKQSIRFRGKLKSDGKRPLLRLEKVDRAAFGKALFDIEGGANTYIEDLRISGAVAQDAGNGTGVLINPNADYVRIQNCEIFDNENGVRSAVSHNPIIDIVNCNIHSNGWSTETTYDGQTHNIYAGDSQLVRINNTTFYNSIRGHNVKSRALKTVLRQVYNRKSNASRELDLPDQGILHVYDSVFWKESTGGQNNLMGIGHECLDGLNRVQEYYFHNCYFHNDVDYVRAVTFLENKTKAADNTVAVHFIDCQFGGYALNKPANTAGSLIYGPYTITLTGGPVGPRVPVGSPDNLWDGVKSPTLSTNPYNIALTPLANLPAKTDIADIPAYPANLFTAVPVVPALPSASIPHGPETPNQGGVGNMLQFAGLSDYPNDAAAAAAGIPVSGVYHTGGVLKVRRV